ncbi:thyrotropin-releasing hormone-degrading ectoenzyme isoform X3 [Drosophila biarmipes]|uniref:thyrotropin-releasing hormone-degrading ectoenzyme isoform X1 n=1 Tax=Drosophila biarmipes TaxID=125945 RepID=UPI0007E73B57|nr:thyrotropin-releasing hormone-degrading ectoenzyme isoform X1 [Drosophila biarmipes]XP_050745394.1 thyrotropin-releasing hormone-degrading ectoenzyme isoform X2 [Drosophila biarmipes]XP_050745396.1 thyrotropin-releasing hormone-degrading ectoenzyme isoform X3 [Drosophila biarmipes]
MHWGYLAVLTALFPPVEGLSDVSRSRLARWVVPLRYRLDIVTRINQPYQPFGGTVVIELRSERPTKKLVLNSRDLEIRKKKGVSLLAKGGKPVAVSHFRLNAPLSRLSVYLKSALTVNATYSLKISYTSVLRNDNNGFYGSSYVDQNTTLAQWLAATQFEPNHAREAFPCFDDPIFRTPFEINLAHPHEYRALSNMPVKRTIRHSSLAHFVWTQFVESHPIQTYLVAFSISKFEKPGFTSKERPGCPISTWARPDALSQTEFANQLVAPLLSFYEQLFNSSLKLKKIDLQALPSFAYRANENWGLPTFAEEAILFDSELSSMADQQGVARAVAVMVVHQWFGNLVSVVWWHQIWLKNAFALYLSRFGVHALRPEWDYKERHALQLYLEVLDHDAHVNTDLVAQLVADETDIWSAYNEIGERKAAVLFDMLHRIMGDEAWRAAVRRYLVIYANRSATASDFWDILQMQVDRNGRLGKGLNITRTMESWLMQPGYPLLRVTRNYDDHSAVVRQDRFFISPQFKHRAAKNPCWWVPLTYTCPSCQELDSSTASRWLTCPLYPSREIQVPTVRLEKVVESAGEWLLLNVQHSAPFRVDYDLRNWQLLNETLSDPVKFRQIHRVNRAQLVDDLFNLAWSGVMEYPMALGILGYLEHEDENVVWDATLVNFERIDNVAKRDHNYRVYKSYMRLLLERQFQRVLSLYLSNSSGNMTHRPLILQLACQYEVPACVSLARREFEKGTPAKAGWMTIRERETVFCTAVKFGTEAEREAVESMYHNSNFAAEQESLLTALACSRNAFALERVLKWTFESVGIRRHNARKTFMAVVSNSVGYSLAMKYVATNMQYIRNYCSNSTNKIVNLLRPLVERLSNAKELDFFTNYFKEILQDMHGMDQMIRILLERGSDNIHWQRTKFRAMLKAIRDIILWKGRES